MSDQAQVDKWRRSLGPYLVGNVNAKGEQRTRCPIHKETRASATTNFEAGLFYCNVCEEGMHLNDLLKRMRLMAKADKSETNVYDFAAAREAKAASKEGRSPLTEAMVLGWTDALVSNSERLTAFMKRRCLNLSTIEHYEVGYEIRTRRYTMPIYDEDGNLVNVRKYKPDPGRSDQKLLNHAGWGSPPRLYPLDQLLQFNEVLLVEGELDALCAIGFGVHAVSGTAGALRWDASWSKMFKGKNVYVLYDNDDEGKQGASKAARAIAPFAKSVRIVRPLLDEAKSDVTDYFLAGGTAAGLRKAMAEGELVESTSKAEPISLEGSVIERIPKPFKEKPREVSLLGSMSSANIGKHLSVDLTVIGKKGPPYSLIELVSLQCEVGSNGRACELCPMGMNGHAGSMKYRVHETNVQILSRLVDAGDKWKAITKSELSIPNKCAHITLTPESFQTVEELIVAGSIDDRNAGTADHTSRRLYRVGGDGDTPTNASARVRGTTWPNPKDSRQEFFGWDLQPSVTSLETFKIDEEMGRRLMIFQPSEDQSILAKAREISGDIAERAAKVVGRERLAMAMDFVFHSILNFRFQGEVLKGVMELIVAGETRTGKTRLAEALIRYYGLGHLVGCESTSFAGLVGGVTQFQNSWQIKWGDIPLNDKRLIVLDEVSGLSLSAISQMSGIRSSGVAQLTKVASGTTNARCRMIWISNSRPNSYIDEKKTEGIDIITDIIGNPEDIARFDLGMSVRSSDVPNKAINRPVENYIPSIYTAELCQNLVLWCWSRTTDQVKFAKGAYDQIFVCAERLGNTYQASFPLIEPASVKDKVARLAVAIAARLFSTDETFENVVVTRAHVMAAEEFMDEIYRYDNFGFYRRSKRVSDAQAVAHQQRHNIRKFIRNNPRLMKFLIGRSGKSFRNNDLSSYCMITKEETEVIIDKLTQANMLSQDKSQQILEPALQDLLREME
jgi:hypothetical protein